MKHRLRTHWRWYVAALIPLACLMAYYVFPHIAFAADGGVEGGPSTPVVPSLPDKDLWAALAGGLTTYVAAFINRTHWANDKRFATFFVLGLVVAFGNSAINGTLDPTNYVRSVLVVLVSGMTWYALNKGAIKAFEARTSGEATTNPPNPNIPKT